MVILNDPYRGGTHLPDITIVAPVFAARDEPAFFVANRAHHADVGGVSPGSMPLSTSIFQEGLIIPPIKLVEKGELDRKIMAFLLNNVRTPVEREGDFAAQIMANLTGVRRIHELITKVGLDMVTAYANGLMDYAERLMRRMILEIPNGRYEFEDVLDDDGLGQEDIKIHVAVTIRGPEAELDFSQSALQVKGCVNAVHAIALSAVLYVFRSLLGKEIPTNAGCLRPLKVRTKRGSVIDAHFPAAVAGGNVETSQRIVDVILGALAKALPERIPAASQGTMNNVTIGGTDPQSGKAFSYYETIAGGMGACSSARGESAVQSHMTNTLNTPVEALEYSYPLRVTEYAIRRGTGGKGRYLGGDGVIREIEALTDAELTVLSERRRRAPYGLFGGQPGAIGKNMILREGQKEEKPGKFTCVLRKGDRVRIETPAGGGYGMV
jgi:N-methylhydantoinase B